MNRFLLLCIGLSCLNHANSHAQSVVYNYDNRGNIVKRTNSTQQNAAKSNQFDEGQEHGTKNLMQLSISPNPTRDIVYVKRLTSDGLMTCRLYDAGSRLLQKEETASTTVKLDLTGYASGTYILSIIQNGSEIIRKIIKK